MVCSRWGYEVLRLGTGILTVIIFTFTLVTQEFIYLGLMLGDDQLNVG